MAHNTPGGLGQVAKMLIKVGKQVNFLSKIGYIRDDYVSLGRMPVKVTEGGCHTLKAITIEEHGKNKGYNLN
jgi:hypothetical protein